jgi:hypothetical protein
MAIIDINIYTYKHVDEQTPGEEESSDKNFRDEQLKRRGISYTDGRTPEDEIKDTLDKRKQQTDTQPIDEGIVEEEFKKGVTLITQTNSTLFLLKQQILYALNTLGYGNIINGPALLNMVPFGEGATRTTVEMQVKSMSTDYIKDLFKLGTDKTKKRSYQEIEGEQADKYIRVPQSTLSSPVDVAVKAIKEAIIPKTFKGELTEGLWVETEPDLTELVYDVDTNFVENTAYLNKSSKYSWGQVVVPFVMESLNYKKDDTEKKIYFQSIITSLSESFAPNWSQDDVFGRIHPIFVYSNVTRTINLEFIIIAKSRKNLPKVYQRANWLTKHTYPVLEENNKFSDFKSGPFIKITIGQLYRDISGFISSIDVDWNFSQKWDKFDELPHGVKVNMKFNVLEQELISNSQETNLYRIPAVSEEKPNRYRTTYFQKMT